MTQAEQGTEARAFPRLSREWRRIRRQAGDALSRLRSIPFRRRLTAPLRERVRRFGAIPAGALASRLAEAFAAPSAPAPRVSVIIPVYNKFEFTARCLLSLAELTEGIPFEIIVVDDGSADATEPALSGLPGLRYHRNGANLGFVDSCNAGARLAAGEFLLFLNNDTLVVPGWLEALVGTFAARPDCGLAGSMLVYPDMALQEAGGLVFRDGSAANRGKGRDLGDPGFNHLRPVDYCSGASIMVRRELFQALGGFDTRYRPAYYEDTDLAFAVRRAGLRVYCQPASKVIHFEGVTAGRRTSGGVKAHQVTNRLKFREKWAEALAGQPERGADAGRTASAGRILVLDHKVPQPDRDSGSADMFNTLKIMVSLGFEVDYLPLARPEYHPRYTPLLQQEGIRCLYRPYYRGLGRLLREGDYDVVFISRIKTIQRSFERVRSLLPRAKIIFNTVDLNFLRVGRRAELEGSGRLARKAAAYREAELRYLNRADASILISPAELDLVAKEVDPSRIAIIPLIREFPARRATFDTSRDLAFIGHFTHRPNVDAMAFFLGEVWPGVRKVLPEVRFHIIGKDFPAELAPLVDEGVAVHGLVPDLDTIFPGLRLCVAPLRFGAGLKGKLATSLGYGVPSVVSPIAIEGMGLVDGEHVRVAETPEEWVDRIRELYEDRPLWEKVSRKGLEFAQGAYSLETNAERFRALFRKLQAGSPGEP